MPAEANWNRGQDLIPAEAAYVKWLCADDWLFPECLSIDVAARRARVELRVQRAGDTVRASGTVTAHGRLPARTVELTATPCAEGRLPAGTDLDAAGFERHWPA